MAALGAFTGRIAFVDLTERTSRVEPLDPELARRYIGSTGINSHLLAELAGTSGTAWDADNPLIVGVGPLVGTLVPGASRTSITTRSPIFGGYGHSNSGSFGDRVKTAGFDHVVVTGIADAPVVLVLDDGAIRIEPAEDTWGKDVYDATDLLAARYRDASIAAIGPAGENGCVGATILTDKHGAFGSSGLGCAMGVKNLKAMVARGHHQIAVADRMKLSRRCLRLFRELMDQPHVLEWRRLGTLISYSEANPGARSRVKEEYGFDIEQWMDLYQSRIWEGPATCPGCPVGCKAKIRSGDHVIQISCPTGSMTNMFGIDMKVDAERYRDVIGNTELANRLGLSTMWSSELTLWVIRMVEDGVLDPSDLGFTPRFGDPSVATRILEDMAHRRTDLGDALAEPFPEAQRRIGGRALDYPLRKGRLLGIAERNHLELGRWNGYSFSRTVDPRGPVAETAYSSIAWIPDRTERQLRSYCDRIGVPPERVDNVLTGGTDGYDLARFTAHIEHYNMIINAIGECNRPYFSRIMDVETIAELMQEATGLELSGQDLVDAGERTMNLQRLFNTARGLTFAADLGDEAMLDPAAAEELAAMLQRYYDEHGWDAHGIPTDATLERLGLTSPLERGLVAAARQTTEIHTGANDVD
jgi:aldehyde:ferredoxin oxidoreductase